MDRLHSGEKFKNEPMRKVDHAHEKLDNFLGSGGDNL